MRRIMLVETTTDVHKGKQKSVIWFLTLENVSGSEIHVRICAVCAAYRMLSQNQLWTDGYKDSGLDEWVAQNVITKSTEKLVILIFDQ